MSDSYNLLANDGNNSSPNSNPTPPTQSEPAAAMPEPVTPTQSQPLYSSESQDASTREQLKTAGFDLSTASEISSGQMANSADTVIDNIVRQATSTKDDEKQILSELEQLDPSLMLNLPVKSQSLKPLKYLFFSSIAVLLVALAFYFGSSNNLTAFTRVDYVTSSQNKVLDLQASKLFQNYLLAASLQETLVLEVNYFNALINQSAPTKELNLAEVNLKNRYQQILTLLNSNQELSAEFPLLSDKVLQKFNEHLSKDNLALDQQSLYRIAKSLSQNSQSQTIENFDSLTRHQLIAAFNSYLQNSEPSLLTQITLAETGRISWLLILQELQTAVRKIDKSFSTTNLNSNRIVFTNYGFSGGENPLLKVTAQVQSREPQVLTLLADLVDAINSVDRFAVKNYQNLTKSFDEINNIYRTNLNLEITLLLT